MKCVVLPLRNYLVFPDCYAPVYVGREASLKAIQMASKGGEPIVVCAQHDAENPDPRSLSDLYSRGTLCTIPRQTRYPGDQAKAILWGERLFEIAKVWFEDGVLWAEGEAVEDEAADQKVSAGEASASQALLQRWYGEKAASTMDEFFEKLKDEPRLAVHTNKICGELARWTRRDKYLRDGDEEVAISPEQNSEFLKRRQVLLETSNARERFHLAQELMRTELG